MKKILIVLFGVLAFQGSVWAYGGEDEKCDAGDPYTQECHAQGLSACWDMTVHPSWPAQSNPWVIGEAAIQNDELKDCRQVIDISLSDCGAICQLPKQWVTIIRDTLSFDSIRGLEYGKLDWESSL